MVSRLVVALCVGVLATAADARSSGPDDRGNKEHIKTMIAFLDGGDWRIDKATEVLGALTQLAPSDVQAQNATVRYLERAASHAIRVPTFFGRLLCRYDAGFARRLSTALARTKDSKLTELWLVTLALMGRKASKEVEPLTQYLHHEGDPVNRMLARIALAMMGTAPPDNFTTIETEVHERTAAGRAAVRMAAFVGFRTWATAKTVSEVSQWLTEDVSEDARCAAAIALAVSGCRDGTVARNMRELLAGAMKDAESSARICYAYALTLLDPGQSDRYWRIIFKKLVPGQLNHTDGSAIWDIIVSIPAEQIAVVNRLRNDPNSDIAVEADKLGKLLEVFESAESGTGEKKGNKLAKDYSAPMPGEPAHVPQKPAFVLPQETSTADAGPSLLNGDRLTRRRALWRMAERKADLSEMAAAIMSDVQQPGCGRLVTSFGCDILPHLYEYLADPDVETRYSVLPLIAVVGEPDANARNKLNTILKQHSDDRILQVLGELPPHQNSWVNSGSGRAPSV